VGTANVKAEMAASKRAPPVTIRYEPSIDPSGVGIVVSVATSGDLLQWHVHLHVLVTDGAFSDDGTFHPLAASDAEALMRLFRERLLARLVEKHAISQELARKLLAWRQPGFSAHVLAGDTVR
jgi:Putative transposase